MIERLRRLLWPKKIRHPRLCSPNYIGRHTGRAFLVLGGGPSIRNFSDTISQFVGDRNPVVLSANIPHPLWGVSMGHTQYVGFTNRRRLGQARTFPSLHDTSCLIGPHIPSRHIWMRNWERMPFVADDAAPFDIVDGIIQCSCHECGWLLTAVAYVMGASEIWMAGVDGYRRDAANHFYEQADYKIELSLRRQARIQSELLPQMRRCFETADVRGPLFLVPTVYGTVEKDYARMPV